ncbi:hypothetical protein [Ralstonia pseudosolanacearum]|uniref:Uncharacterized protein n=1 Tax=Ralstonia nicotianae (strain ATCC BAA-1114 / GMI1000) TaxID=267608 RepID=Q8XY96_RALN1|nr:hypothetical protein [Ralstonia pseudosolanacearum]MCQ4681169.1 hypothetical protein [Ralstonia pseudosolanacearum]MDC6285825.1 hypothetical protein [Ralstonia pseudosolanacearum]CAD15569.1 hypothetical protein RSc1867 [Ralstonia pseudosolanacearum GMI1000]
MIYVAIEPADHQAFVLIRASANPNPERKPPMRVARAMLPEVLELLLDTAVEAGTC